MTSFDPNPPRSIDTHSANPAPHVVAEDELDRLLAHDAEQRRREREETRNWMYGFSVAGVLLGVIALVASLFAVTRSTGTTTKTVVATTPAAAGAAAGGASSSAAAPPGHEVTASLTEMRITDSVAKVAAGKVTFKVTNNGSVAHEYVILRTSQPASGLPMAGGKASEAGHVGEIGDLPVGATKSVTLNLKPGHYSIICNLPGHYTGGMHTDLTVT
ncbi:hypothetical protein FSW04_06410 [Baekduia soli]|uniref:Blue (type 1) copper domain-containing protein n=1 Tax=Baekduia soli TaxID=496014 RepID=A0A5B8U2J8_9ACTN|nr:hypothetical protein [Baekduia soli]QEC47257.1 hypothetical protein FSW04_06410 [Baekduia soli]